jgi:protein SCO1
VSQSRSIKLTVVCLLAFIILIVAGFVHRIFLPRVMTESDMKVNGLYLLDTPRNIGEFELIDHHGEPFDRARFEGRWSLVFFGFTFCPDICPTTMALLNKFVESLEGTEAEDTQVQQLASYVTYFNSNFTGVTGEYLDIHRLATALNTPFRKVTGEGGNYQVDHSANVVLINPRGDYHGFFKAPLDLAKMKATYRSARALWEQ